ncbi:TonB-dependent receptor [Cellulophaga baltica]|uniref:TonB-dependent receptor n=1 Tax=Cellulophaga baltica TaxID=76594 RepID=UPI00249491E8|nr:TonB-dependent receptor [Cellulophaga baltica]
MNKIKSISLFLVGMLSVFCAYAQEASYSGTVTDVHGEPIEGATLHFNAPSIYGVTTKEGAFTIKNIPLGTYRISIAHLGYKTLDFEAEITENKADTNLILEGDYLSLQAVVVTGSFTPLEAKNTATSVSTLEHKRLKQIYPQGTASLLQNITGTFTDASAGEVFTKVYTRGISAAAEDDLGWYYVSLQEDGLPVSLVQHSYYSPDLFHRVDLMTQRVEAIRGGNASITAMNAPGGIYNFISPGIRNEFGGEVQVLSALQHSGNTLFKVDGVIGGPLGSNWFFNAGGHYRKDEGARDVDFTFSKGGQFKFNVIKKFDKGSLKLHGKLLDDYTNRWTGVAATNWENPEAAFGQNFNSTSLLMPEFTAAIPDSRNLQEGATNSFNPAQGVHAKDLAFGADFFQDLGNNWSLQNLIKYSNKNANWQTSISNAFVSLDNPLAYFISGASFPIGEVVFRDTQSGSEIARVNNAGILAGEPAEYIGNGTLPNDAIMGTSAWYKENKASEWMNEFSLHKKIAGHNFTGGLALGFSDTSLFTQGSFGYVTYEPNPKMLQVSLENPNEPTSLLSDENGISNYGGLFFMNAEAQVSQIGAFVNDRWEITDRIDVDLGLRYEDIRHKGSKDRYAPFSQDGGLDGDATTAYDNGILAPTGDKDAFDFNYNYLSFSGGINFKINKEASVFTRFSKGNKAPELNYYFNNFANVPINQKGEVQKITQAEVGIKYSLSDFSLTSTVFWSQLDNIGNTNFEFDGETNSVFYTPILFNTSRTLGLEWEAVYTPFRNFKFLFNGVLQNPKATEWLVYDAAGSVAVADDTTIDYSGNTLPFNPKVMFNVLGAYELDKLSVHYKWQFMGERQGNVANAFTLADYSISDAGIGYQFTKHISANLLVVNMFNSDGLANFFGANSFGANANGATSEFIQNNPDESFVVVPVLPRSTSLRVNYTF